MAAIDHGNLKVALFQLNDSQDDALISHQLTGLLAGIALAVKDPRLAKKIDRILRGQWNDTHRETALTDPGALYGAGLMAEKFIEIFGED